MEGGKEYLICAYSDIILFVIRHKKHGLHRLTNIRTSGIYKLDLTHNTEYPRKSPCYMHEHFCRIPCVISLNSVQLFFGSTSITQKRLIMYVIASPTDAWCYIGEIILCWLYIYSTKNIPSLMNLF